MQYMLHTILDEARDTRATMERLEKRMTKEDDVNEDRAGYRETLQAWFLRPEFVILFVLVNCFLVFGIGGGVLSSLGFHFFFSLGFMVMCMFI